MSSYGNITARSKWVNDDGTLTREAYLYLTQGRTTATTSSGELDPLLFLDAATTQELAKEQAAQREDFSAGNHARLSEVEKAVAGNAIDAMPLLLARTAEMEKAIVAQAMDAIPLLLARSAELQKQLNELTELVSSLPNIGPLLTETRKAYATLDSPVFTTAVGFNGSAAIGKQTVTGSRGANAALASVLTALANAGLITDSTTA